MEDNKKKNNKRIAIYVASFVCLALLCFGLFMIYNKANSNPNNSQNKQVEESKDVNNKDNEKKDEDNKAAKITVKIVGKDNKEEVFQHDTDAQFLRQALEEIEGIKIEGEESATGLYVKTINGVTADYNVDKSYWAFYVNEEYCQSGVDTQKVTDGDIFKIVYTKEN